MRQGNFSTDKKQFSNAIFSLEESSATVAELPHPARVLLFCFLCQLPFVSIYKSTMRPMLLPNHNQVWKPQVCLVTKFFVCLY